MADDALRDLLRRARRIAVVGASPRPERDSHRILVYLRDAGYEVVPVNPAADQVAGVRAVADLAAAGAVDVVDVFRRSEHVAALVDECLRLGLPALWLQLDVKDDSAVARARAAGVTVVEDRCIMVEHRRLLG
jgi:predicted CoA-binding protein